MKFDGLPGEKEIMGFQLIDGYGWLTTDRIVIRREKYSRLRKVKGKLWPEMYLLRDFQKAVIAGEKLYVYFKGLKMAIIRLRIYAPSILKEIKDYIEETAKYCHN